ncbi:MAG: Gfo/Idh/MocA family oxidoreductase [Chloroflexia bacterium]|nr:Gfo/Idh/MocA family oxidoreductase [Chloroflexia bacterium]
MANGTGRTRPIRLGIIGTGLAVEKLHWPALRQMPDRYRVVAFANRGRANAEKFAAYSSTPLDAWVTDYRELLARDDVDAVLISLPIPLNYPVSKDALEAGKHVVCEKPAGKNLAEGRAFVELAARHPDRVLLIAENWFYRDDLRLARSLLDEGRIGRVHLVAWRQVSQMVPRPGEFSSTPWRHDPGYEGGPHLDAGVHHAAQLRLLCGDIDRVSGEIQDANSTHGGPSDLALTLRFVGGGAGSYAASYPELIVPEEPNELRLYGTEAVMTVGQDGVRLHHPDGTVEAYRVEGADGGYYNEFLDFAEAVGGGVPVVGTVAQSFRTMELILGGLASARRGEAVAIGPWPDPLAASAVPLWRPAGATGLFDGLPATVVRAPEEAS